MSDIKTKIEKALKEISNEFNTVEVEHKLKNIDKMVAQIETVLEKSTQPVNVDAIIAFRLSNTERTLIKEFETLSLVDGVYGRSYIYLKTKIGHRLYDELYTNTKEESLKIAEQENKIRVQKFTEVKSINFPSGKIIFANYFPSENDYAFGIEEDLKYDTEYSINSRRGQQNCMTYMAKNHDCGYAQLGNTSCAIYKKSDDEIILTSDSMIAYDDNGNEIEGVIPKDYEYAGSIECNVWRVEFIDCENFEKADNIDHDRFNDIDQVVVSVNPGEWSFKNHYFSCNDSKAIKENKIPVWVELKRKKGIK